MGRLHPGAGAMPALARRPCRLSARLPGHVRDDSSRWTGPAGPWPWAATPTTRSRPASSAARCPTTWTVCTPPTGCCTRSSGTGPRARRSFRRASWDEALERVAAGLTCGVRDEHGGEAVLPVQLRRYAGPDPGQHDERTGDERARRLGARAHDLRHRRHGRAPSPPTASRPRLIPRSGRTPATSCSGAGTRCPPRRTSGASCSRRAAPAREWWWWTRSAAAPHAWRTSTCSRSRAPTPRWPWG